MEEIVETDHHYLITIAEMEEKIKETPKQLNHTAWKKSCCIFRVPQHLVQINEKAYHPQILSIGPYHHGKPHLNMIEELKWKYLGQLLDRTPNGLKLDGYLKLVAPMENQIRDCYSEYIPFNGSDLIKMMVLDGLFIIELLSKWGHLAPRAQGDPIFKMVWILTFVGRDLLRLENQIPFFVLQTLFENTRVTRRSGGDGESLAKLFVACFKYVMRRPDEALKRIRNVEGEHLLDLFRLSFIPASPQQKPRNKDVQLIPSVEKLNAAGIKFKAIKCDTFLDITFHKGILEIPHIRITDSTSYFFLNSLAFEQCHCCCCSSPMTAYVVFMGLLIKNPSDVGFLCDKEVMGNYFGTEKEVVQFFGNLGKDLICDFSNNYLSKVAEDVNEYRRKGWHVQWAGFKHTYFNTPWAFISALAALTLLLLTIIQAFFAVYPYAGGKRIG